MQFLKQNTALALVGILFLFCVCVWSLVYAQSPLWRTGGTLTFAVLNVGQGDSLYIEGPTGIQVVVDGGPDNSLLRELPTVMPLFDRSLDAVIETHPDADHISGFIDLLKRYHVGVFIEPGIEKDTATAQALEQEIGGAHVPRVIARRGMWLDLGGLPGQERARLHVLFPDYDVSHINQKADNNGGIVAHLVYGNTSVLLTADITTSIEEHLMQISSSAELASTILKVAHHGSRFSSSGNFIAAVSPQVAIISVGAHNSYGHPTQRVLDTLADYRINVLRTDKNGTVTCRSNGVVFSCSTKN